MVDFIHSLFNELKIEHLKFFDEILSTAYFRSLKTKIDIKKVEVLMIKEILEKWEKGDTLYENEIIECINMMLKDDEKGVIQEIKRDWDWNYVPEWKSRKEQLEMAFSPLNVYKEIQKLKKRNQELEDSVTKKPKFDGLLIEK